MASSSSSYNSPCAACKFLRRKCMPGCIFAPYFPPEDPQKFANVHKIFGASNVTKLLNDLLPHQREDAVNSLAYEAEARVRDPVYGCVGAISFLQRQVQRLQKELDAANADLIRYACNEIIATPGVNPVLQQQMTPRRRSIDHHQFYHQQGGATIPPPAANFQVPYNLPWNVDHQNRTSGDQINEGGGGGEGGM
ncbi:PREDICTED: protein LATERAL ORGAN BOUNDARIES-like [Fragaria vesca subsp. vesca]|uniref:protein LATERAL ORGAN BOUNDARIES-like n=1 Tax=Fragaria vesca subsp. vesca TaxID=101020 RepID=UPI0002C35088|nr:PREDICTED: protein LATERAL ORGAN BOUNDARIES-like [Fragaria vesca subsp. vesca]XP_011464037.1 PREDICTED: protein LATERAL ORGAN BOUNDARIES-like [Fragaria vesca subsp. vesca]